MESQPFLKCVQCGAETQLLRAEIPYCVKCVDRVELMARSEAPAARTVVDTDITGE